jgi:hypothetical protein
MQGQEADIFRKLCEQAAVEQDHDRLLWLIKEITRMLDAKEGRVRQAQVNKQGRR